MKAVWVALRGLLVTIPAVLVSLYAGATGIVGSSFWPWRLNMIDMGAYLRASNELVAGRSIYDPIPGFENLPYLYPPLPAALFVPMTWFPLQPAQIGWLVANALLVVAIVRRFDLHGWTLAWVSAAAVALVDPMRASLAFGQVNIVLMALVVLDLMPGPRLLGRFRVLPQGWLTGLAAAIKLTPALFVVFLLLAGRRRAAVVAMASFVVLTGATFALWPAQSERFWFGGMVNVKGTGSLKYFANQSIIANFVRFTRSDPNVVPLPALLLALAVCGVGVLGGVWWHSLGKARLGLALTALSAVVVSPIAWQHHYVWAVPVALTLVLGHDLPPALRGLGMLTAVWIMYAPNNYLPDHSDEFTWPWPMLLVDAGSAILVSALLVLALVLGLVERRRCGLGALPRPVAPPTHAVDGPPPEDIPEPKPRHSW